MSTSRFPADNFPDARRFEAMKFRSFDVDRGTGSDSDPDSALDFDFALGPRFRAGPEGPKFWSEPKPGV